MPRRRAARPTLTIKAVDAAVRDAKEAGKAVLVWDGLTAGFGAKCLPSGHVAWVWQGDVARRTRRITLNARGELTLAQARDAAEEVASRVALGENVADARVDRRESEKLTLKLLVERYFRERGSRLRERSKADYEALMNRNVLLKLGARPATDITEADVAHVHAKVTARGASRQANYTVAVLQAIFSWAIRQKLVASNPAKGVELNQEKHRERVASPAEIVRLREVLAAWPNRTMADAISLLLLTGARSGEVLNATWGQFDLEAGAWTKPASTTKQKRTHRLPLAEDAVALLKARYKDFPGTPAALAFAEAGGDRMTDQEFVRRWVSIRKKAGIQGLNKHDLRHTAASILAASGASLPLIGSVLGHSTPITTSRYAHLVDAPMRAAAERIAATLSAPPSKTAAVAIPLNRDATR